MISVWRSDTGLVRSNNEDHVIVDEGQAIFLLADGLGGHAAGEVASEIAVKEAYTYLLSGLSDNAGAQSIPHSLVNAFQLAHRVIHMVAEGNKRFQGMGTTLIAAVIRDGIAYLCHTGDSRAYLYRDYLQRMTRNHTVAQEILDRQGTESSEIPSWQWHTLTECIGMEREPVPVTRRLPLQEGDILLLCSDGLTDMLHDHEIERILSSVSNDPDKTITSLVDTAKLKGGIDNISVILVYY